MTPARQTRQHFGQGSLAFDRATSVFINCPYDEDFRPRFDAVVFAAVCCGFMPRSALETGTVAEPRIARILQALIESKYSIHDLSRCAFISDISGFDPGVHDGSASAIVTTVTTWLATRRDAVRTPNPQQVISALPEFDEEIRALRDTWGPFPPWADMILAGMQIAKQFEAKSRYRSPPLMP